MANVDTKNCSESMLNGMSNFITTEQWRSLINDRIDYTPNATNDKLLSKDFIIKHKNFLMLSSLPLYCLIAWDKCNLDVDFLKRFLHYIDFSEGNDILLDFKEFTGNSSGFYDTYKGLCDMTDTALIHAGEVKPFSMEELDKRPLHYNGQHWIASLNKMDKVDIKFLEKYIHMVNFMAVLNNPHLTEAKRKDIRDYFGVKVKDRNTWILPCGASVTDTSWREMTGGLPYLKNKNRFAYRDDEEAIKTIVAKFPRAFEDCLSGGNELVMVDK